jgi:hypothetical protein
MSDRALSIIACAIALLPGSVIGQKVKNTPTHEMTLDELSRTVVVGRLGKPLGTIVTVEGRFSVPKAVTKDFEYELLVTAVNGKVVKVKIPHDQVEWEPYLEYLKVVREGQPFRLIGYERAQYSGYIKGEAEFDRRFETYQRTPEKWGLHSRFHILAQRTEAKEVQQADPQSK